MATDLLLYLWPVSLGSGLIYRIVGRRDPMMHVVLCVGIAFTFAACACMTLWLLFGGWGPPPPLLFGLAGLVIGVAVGLATMRLSAFQTN